MKSIRLLLKAVAESLTPRKIIEARISIIEDKRLLEGKVALVTGGSSGFGFAIAKRFLDCGAKVIITGRNHEKLDAALKKLNSKNVKGLIWDISLINDVQSKFGEICSLFGELDIAVNNAGVWSPKKWNYISEEDWDKIIDTNLKGLFFVCQAEGEYMQVNNSKIKKIINVTSIEGIRGGFGPYWASKWGANGLTKGLAKLLTPKNVIVNAIAPGMGITDINPNLPKDGNLALNNLNGRFVAVEEVAELALFLASDASNSIVGQVITIDGGMSLN